MWRTKEERRRSAEERLAIGVGGLGLEAARRAAAVVLRPGAGAHRGLRAALGEDGGVDLDVASLALAEAAAGRDCRQPVVAPTDGQARLLGEAVADRVRAAFEGGETLWTAGLACGIRQRPCLQITVWAENVTDPIISNHKRVRGAGPCVSHILCRTAARDGASLRGLWAYRIVVDEASRVPDIVMTEVMRRC